MGPMVDNMHPHQGNHFNGRFSKLESFAQPEPFPALRQSPTPPSPRIHNKADNETLDEFLVGMSGSQILHEMILRHGVKHIFGPPGGVTSPMFDSIYQSADLDLIVSLSEDRAGFMAEGYSRVSGKPGVVLVEGTGLSNIITPMQEALMDGSPLIVLYGKTEKSADEVDALREAEMFQASRGCTKWNCKVEDITELPRCITNAFKVATNGRPGPVLVELPKHVSAEVLQQALSCKWTTPSLATRFKQASTPSQSQPRRTFTMNSSAIVSPEVGEKAKLISKDHKPVNYAGESVFLCQEGPEALKKINLGDLPMRTVVQPTGFSSYVSISVRASHLDENLKDISQYSGSISEDPPKYSWRLPLDDQKHIKTSNKSASIPISPMPPGKFSFDDGRHDLREWDSLTYLTMKQWRQKSGYPNTKPLSTKEILSAKFISPEVFNKKVSGSLNEEGYRFNKRLGPLGIIWSEAGVISQSHMPTSFCIYKDEKGEIDFIQLMRNGQPVVGKDSCWPGDGILQIKGQKDPFPPNLINMIDDNNDAILLLGSEEANEWKIRNLIELLCWRNALAMAIKQRLLRPPSSTSFFKSSNNIPSFVWTPREDAIGATLQSATDVEVYLSREYKFYTLESKQIKKRLNLFVFSALLPLSVQQTRSSGQPVEEVPLHRMQSSITQFAASAPDINNDTGTADGDDPCLTIPYNPQHVTQDSAVAPTTTTATTGLHTIASNLLLTLKDWINKAHEFVKVLFEFIKEIFGCSEKNKVFMTLLVLFGLIVALSQLGVSIQGLKGKFLVIVHDY